MKTTSVLLLFAGILLMAGCQKKDHKCLCTTSYSDGSLDGMIFQSQEIFHDMSRHDARKQCRQNENDGGGYSGGSNTKCGLVE